MRKALRFTTLLTVLMTVTGLYAIPAVASLDPAWQNIIYRLGSTPLFFVSALIVYGPENDK